MSARTAETRSGVIDSDKGGVRVGRNRCFAPMSVNARAEEDRYASVGRIVACRAFQKHGVRVSLECVRPRLRVVDS